MNRLNITSILASIITERDENMQQLVAQLSDGKKTSGSPIAIRFKPAGDSHLIEKGILHGRVVLVAGGNDLTHQRDSSAITQ